MFKRVYFFYGKIYRDNVQISDFSGTTYTKSILPSSDRAYKKFVDSFFLSHEGDSIVVEKNGAHKMTYEILAIAVLCIAFGVWAQ